jgi:hypothetical protein
MEELSEDRVELSSPIFQVRVLSKLVETGEERKE